MGYEPIPRIEPVPPAPSLLTSSRTMPGDWRSGVGFGTGCQPSSQLFFCPMDVAREDAESQTVEQVLPFWIYTPLQCNLGSGPVTISELPEHARNLTETHTAHGIASTLWMGTGYAPDDAVSPTLRNSAQDISLGTADTLDTAIAQLLAHYELATGGEGGAVIHIPSALAVYALGGGAGGARICWPEGSLYRGPLNSIVVPGPGYPLGRSLAGAHGYGPGSGDNASGHYAGNDHGQSWVYVSGPVEYAVGDIELQPDENERVQVRTNIYSVDAARPAVVRFDPCKVFGTLAINPAIMPEVS